MRLVFFGTPQFAVPSLERLLGQPGVEVVAVVTQPDKRRGRGSELVPSPVKAIALQHDLPIWQPARIKKDAETLENLRRTQADAFIVVAYGQILSPEILDMPRLGCINAHGSLLPKYRGAAPIQWSLYHGETETGITTMLMDAGMDTGPMLLKATTPIGWFDHAHDLATVLANQAADLLIDTLLGLDQGKVQPIPQDDAQATYAPLIQKQDYWLDWNRGAIALHNQVRGFYPNCLTHFRGQPLKVLSTVPLTTAPDLPIPDSVQSLRVDWQPRLASPEAPGTIVGLLKHHGVLVNTSDGLLLLLTVQPSGKRPQSGWDWANGTRLAIGDSFTSSPT
ncbi:methionyl-tRNA formyltransferase [Thermoleptolyngbya oregonensis NK1-22]|uniref:Methionyl-tRNA formyltransferase n=1 Tax=Thermoleptolyngbya oregonensis NK1-22 TaxID=2547457 RepID=A0AA96Y5X6_9CYAN|nr:methionyl-tRNA formyltransferase [Thermoleptolyngbya oregonensis]WOB44076.1 methionyl-tRNA formyltransferase [Thermoleptolyngbya oregonensis NK1-22]